MFIISFVLNIITLAIVGALMLVVYMSYRKRPDVTSTPMDVMRDIVAGQAGPARIYKIIPFKRLLTGPIGEFGSNDTQEYSNLGGNTYDHVSGEKPWDRLP